MFNLLTFILGIACIFLIARYNKSNKLFWVLLISMLSGFVGGSIATRVTRDSKKELNINQSTLMQEPIVSTAMFADYAILEAARVAQKPTNPASQIYSERDLMSSSDPETDTFESDVGNLLEYPNTS